MLMPSIFGENLFDDLMNFPFEQMDRQMNRADHRLYGHSAGREMKTDVREHEDGYEIDIDLPGFKKDQIGLSLEKGFLTVTASKAVEQDKENKGRLIRHERYEGTMQRSFYVGEEITVEDVKARFEDGVLHLDLPKPDKKPLPQKKTIAIE